MLGTPRQIFSCIANDGFEVRSSQSECSVRRDMLEFTATENDEGGHLNQNARYAETGHGSIRGTLASSQVISIKMLGTPRPIGVPHHDSRGQRGHLNQNARYAETPYVEMWLTSAGQVISIRMLG